MPAAFAFSAMRWPTTSAAFLVAPVFILARSSFSVLEALARILSPAGDVICA
jgi:hypothetical protein